MKRIKISENTLDKVLSMVMLEPSITKHLNNGDVYAYASDWCNSYTVEKTFKRRKVLRLIRKFKRNYTYNSTYCSWVRTWKEKK